MHRHIKTTITGFASLAREATAEKNHVHEAPKQMKRETKGLLLLASAGQPAETPTSGKRLENLP